MGFDKEKRIAHSLMDSFIELLSTSPMTAYNVSVCFSTILLFGMDKEDQFKYTCLLDFIKSDVNDQNFEDDADFFDWVHDKMTRFRQLMEDAGTSEYKDRMKDS